MADERFPLVNGRCPVCETQVEHEVDGVRMRFMPHDDPDWCRAAAQYNTKALRRALEGASEGHFVACEQTAFYRHAFACALRKLAEVTATHPEEWRQPIERKIHEERQRAKERDLIALTEAKAKSVGLF